MTKEYLNSYRVRKILNREINLDVYTGEIILGKSVTQICQLQPKNPITKEKIISDLKCELMNKYCAEGCNQHIWVSEIFDWLDEKLRTEKSKLEQMTIKLLREK